MKLWYLIKFRTFLVLIFWIHPIYSVHSTDTIIFFINNITNKHRKRIKDLKRKGKKTIVFLVVIAYASLLSFSLLYFLSTLISWNNKMFQPFTRPWFFINIFTWVLRARSRLLRRCYRFQFKKVYFILGTFSANIFSNNKFSHW